MSVTMFPRPEMSQDYPSQTWKARLLYGEAFLKLVFCMGCRLRGTGGFSVFLFVLATKLASTN